MAGNNEKPRNEKYSVGPVLLRENIRTCKMRHKHCMTWNVGRKLNNVENETRKMYVLENWRNTEKRAN